MPSEAVDRVVPTDSDILRGWYLGNQVALFGLQTAQMVEIRKNQVIKDALLKNVFKVRVNARHSHAVCICFMLAVWLF